MAQYIDKDVVVAKIKELIRENELYLSEHATDAVRLQKISAYSVLNDLLHSVDTLEVKEVDENEYVNKYFKGWYVDLTDQGNILHTPDGNAGLMSVKEVAKHFFELGLKAARKEE